jgi:hypothetical protein
VNYYYYESRDDISLGKVRASFKGDLDGDTFPGLAVEALEDAARNTLSENIQNEVWATSFHQPVQASDFYSENMHPIHSWRS